MSGEGGEPAVGERISRLATNFDFEALGRLADSLGAR
jgi:hypothetical protein